MTINIERGRYWDRAWNPITGCTPCSPTCANCWAARMVARFPHLHSKGEIAPFSEPQLHSDRLDQPARWRDPQIVATCWLGDLYYKKVPESYKNAVYRRIDINRNHIYLMLSKRPPSNKMFSLLQNAFWGMSAYDQSSYRYAAMNLAPAFVRGYNWLSIEPILGPTKIEGGSFHWIVAGAETGPRARPAELDWFRSIRDDCDTLGIPFFLKSLGPRKGRMLDGRTHDEFPPEIQKMLDGRDSK